MRQWIADWRRAHPGRDIRPVLEAVDEYPFIRLPATALIAAITTQGVSHTNQFVSLLLENGADVNNMWDSGGLMVSPLDFSVEAYLAYPCPAAFDTIEMLTRRGARYGDGWRTGCFDVGPLGGPRAQAGCLAGAAARVLAFAGCAELHLPDIWDNVELEPGVPLLAHALNGFSMPYIHADPDEVSTAMRAWCGRGPGSVADVVLKLQESPAALNMLLQSVDPQEARTCGNNAAYQAFSALNAVPLFAGLAGGDDDFQSLANAAQAGKSVCAARLITGRASERIAQFEREVGAAETPVTRGVQVEYLHRVAAAVSARLPEQLASRLFAVLPDEALVPSGSHVHRACARSDHDAFINCLAVDCDAVLRGERPDLLVDALVSAPGVRTVWQERLLACVDREWDALQVTAPGESRDEMFTRLAKQQTRGAEKISDDLMSPVADIGSAEFDDICKRVKSQREIVAGSFCNCLTKTIVENAPSFLSEPWATRSAVASALRGRSIKKATTIPWAPNSHSAARMPPKSVTRTPFR